VTTHLNAAGRPSTVETQPPHPKDSAQDTEARPDDAKLLFGNGRLDRWILERRVLHRGRCRPEGTLDGWLLSPSKTGTAPTPISSPKKSPSRSPQKSSACRLRLRTNSADAAPAERDSPWSSARKVVPSERRGTDAAPAEQDSPWSSARKVVLSERRGSTARVPSPETDATPPPRRKTGSANVDSESSASPSADIRKYFRCCAIAEQDRRDPPVWRSLSGAGKESEKPTVVKLEPTAECAGVGPTAVDGTITTSPSEAVPRPPKADIQPPPPQAGKRSKKMLVFKVEPTSECDGGPGSRPTATDDVTTGTTSSNEVTPRLLEAFFEPPPADGVTLVKAEPTSECAGEPGGGQTSVDSGSTAISACEENTRSHLEAAVELTQSCQADVFHAVNSPGSDSDRLDWWSTSRTKSSTRKGPFKRSLGLVHFLNAVGAVKIFVNGAIS